MFQQAISEVISQSLRPNSQQDPFFAPCVGACPACKLCETALCGVHQSCTLGRAPHSWCTSRSESQKWEPSFHSFLEVLHVDNRGEPSSTDHPMGTLHLHVQQNVACEVSLYQYPANCSAHQDKHACQTSASGHILLEIQAMGLWRDHAELQSGTPPGGGEWWSQPTLSWKSTSRFCIKLCAEV